jgi:hypothetical protein
MQTHQGFDMPSQTSFEQQMNEMRVDMREMRGAIVKMAEAMTKLSVLEERNSIIAIAHDKLAEKVEQGENKLSAVVLEQAKFESKVGGITSTMKMMWAVFGGGVLYLGSQAIPLLTNLPKP